MIWGIIHKLCGDSTLDENNFRTDCLDLLNELSLMYSQSVADLPAPPDNMSQSLVFVKALPKGAELLSYSGQYLVVDEMSPKFKFEGQRSVDDDRLQLANLRYFDQKGDSCAVYIPQSGFCHGDGDNFTDVRVG